MDAKKAKKMIQSKAKELEKKGVDLEGVALKELAKMKSKMEKAAKQVESYARKNPEKAMLISAGVVAALAGAAALLSGKKPTGKKKK